MPAPVFTLPLSGADPKIADVADLESGINYALNILSGRIDALALGLVPKGGWDATSGAFPSGAVTGDYYIVSDGGTVDGEAFATGDSIIALADGASTTTYAANWFRVDGASLTRVTEEFAPAASFALSNDPVNKAHVQVFYNGALQSVDEYTLSGSTLTITGGEPAGISLVQISYSHFEV